MAREQEPGGMELLILHLLRYRDRYGYEIISELSLRSENVFQLKEGTLYPLLHRLEKNQLVETYETKYENRVRRYYHLTKRGLQCLETKTEEWNVYAKAVNAVLCTG